MSSSSWLILKRKSPCRICTRDAFRCENENLFGSFEDLNTVSWSALLSGNLVSPGSATLTWTSLCSRFAWCSAKPFSQRLSKEHWRTLNWSPKVKYHSHLRQFSWSFILGFYSFFCLGHLHQWSWTFPSGSDQESWCHLWKCGRRPLKI